MGGFQWMVEQVVDTSQTMPYGMTFDGVSMAMSYTFVAISSAIS